MADPDEAPAGLPATIIGTVRNNMIAAVIIVVLIVIIAFLTFPGAGEKKKVAPVEEPESIEEFENLMREINDGQQ